MRTNLDGTLIGVKATYGCITAISLVQKYLPNTAESAMCIRRCHIAARLDGCTSLACGASKQSLAALPETYA